MKKSRPFDATAQMRGPAPRLWPAPFCGVVRAAAAAVLLLCVRGGFATENEKQSDDATSSGATILKGYQRYQGVCGHCHGPDGVGSTFAPSLIERPLAYEEFREVALNGRARGTFVMPGYAADPNIVPYIDAIHLYLEARREGLGRGRPPP